MGPLFLFPALLFLLCAICGSLLFIVGLILKSRVCKIIGGIALAPVVAVVICLLIFFGIANRRSRDPTWVFEQEFLIPPPHEVTALRGYATEPNNGGFAYLRFSAPPEVIDALVSDWMVPSSPSDLQRSQPRLSHGHPPSWWAPPAVPPAKFYGATHLRKMCDGCGRSEVLYYDPATHVAYLARF